MKKGKNIAERIKKLKTYTGKECIYHERELYIHAVIYLVEAGDWGVWLTLKDLNSPGFTSGLRPNPESQYLKVSACWDFFGMRDDKWGAYYSGWTIFFDSRFIKAVCQYAQTIKDKPAPERIRAFLNCIHQLQYKKSFLYIKK
jgi:hypothetical protein